MTIEEKCITTIRCLAMDAVQKANSGHPGTPMALAPAAYVLWMKHLRYQPQNPQWINRDRFILSNGHASMLLYAMLYLTGYNLTLEDIKHFRQWGSRTPGHPENALTPGVETTTGPLGQGIMTAVGIAIAEAHLAAVFNQDEHVVDHYTYFFCSDGDLMEGASHEAGSLAGHLGLGKLIGLYDNNHITIEGNTSLAYSDNVKMRFEAYGWHVVELGDAGNDLEAISKAFDEAKAVGDRPSMILLRTHIGYGSPHKQDTPEAHGAPLGEEEVRLTKEAYGWPVDESFLIPDDVKLHMNQMVVKGKQLEQKWKETIDRYKSRHPDLYEKLQQYKNQDLPENWDKNVRIYLPDDGPIATRQVNSDFLNAVADRLPWLIGGSGDLEPSTLTMIKSSGYIEKNEYKHRNLAFGIREHVMCSAATGITMHGGLRAYAATFFIFSDYGRPAIRLACIMDAPVIFVMTHDSIGLGEDGTTHQPVEHLASFRAMPHMCVVRPADANEASWAWRLAVERTEGPTMLIMTRQKLPVFDRSRVTPADGVLRGAYILSREKGDQPQVILMATGSEVQLILQAQMQLTEMQIDARVVSFPCWEIFREQPRAYRDSVLPPTCLNRLAVEAGSVQGWGEWIGEQGDMIGMSSFGSSAPAKTMFKEYGFTVDNIVEHVDKMLHRVK